MRLAAREGLGTFALTVFLFALTSLGLSMPAAAQEPQDIPKAEAKEKEVGETKAEPSKKKRDRKNREAEAKKRKAAAEKKAAEKTPPAKVVEKKPGMKELAAKKGDAQNKGTESKVKPVPPTPPTPPQPKKPTEKKNTEKKAPAKPANEDARLDALEKKIDALVDMMQKQAAKPAKGASEESKGTGAAPETKDAEKPKPEETVKKEPAKSSEKAAAGPRKEEKTGLKIQPQWMEQLAWRAIGPANMSGRIADISVDDEDPSLWWIGTAGAGLLKTTNHGVRVSHQFDHETTSSVGAVAHAPSNKQIVWVGTGEANPRNSVSYGNGVYKSTDGGATWEHKGLEKTFQISRVLIHPKNPDVVYIGAAGRLYGPSRERGVYKTTDGGENWEQVLYLDDNTGVIDMIMNPEDPEMLIVAMWDRMRDGFDSWPGSVKRPDGIDGYDPIRKYGPSAGLYKTSNGGQDWTRLSNGLPPGKIGRIGLDWQRKASGAIYAIIDCEEIGKGPKPFEVYLGLVGLDQPGEKEGIDAVVTQVMPESPAAKAGLKRGDKLTSIDGNAVKQFDDLLEVLRKKKLGQKIKLSLMRGEESIEIDTKLAARPGSNRQVPTVYLGVTGETKDEKVQIKTVSKNTPASKAGLKAGDIVLTASGKTVESYEALVKQVQAMSDGEELPLGIQRGEETVKLTATVANRPSQTQRTSNRSFMGIQGEDQPGGGAKMLVITEGGPSEKAGMKAGDVIKKVAGADMANYQALIAEIRKRDPNEKMKVTVQRGEKKLDLVVTLGDRNAGSSDRPYTFSYFGQRANIQDMQGAEGYRYGGIYKSTDAGETWERVNSLNTRPMYFSVIRVDPSDDQRVYVLGVSQFKSEDGGVTFQPNFGRGVHADGHDLWIDPADGRHMIIAGDGGVYTTFDYGNNWDHINTAAIGQFYHVAISPKKPYWVVGGLQDNGSWAGPAISKTGGAINEDWISVGGGDGFVCRVDPNDPDLMYYESQNGAIARRHLVTGERASLRPRRQQGTEYRFNWEAPFILSSHNSRIFYSAGNYVFRSLDRGNDLQAISPEITKTKRGSATDLAESPVDPNVLYVGTDDGALWVTKDGGVNWKDITENLNAPGLRWVSSIEASRHAAGTVYVVLDAHRSDDDNPYVYVSDDHGETFRALHKGLPFGSTRCLREDPVNKDLLYLGTEFAFWISLDRGENWVQAKQVPTVSIHDVATHPSVNEIVLATHGRSLWACDVSVLRSLNRKAVAGDAVFFKPQEVVRWRSNPRRGGTNRRFVGQNPASGAGFWYWLSKDTKSVSFKVKNIQGDVISEINADGKQGLHQARWNLTQTANRSGGGQRRLPPGFRGRGRPVASGSYQVAMVVDGKEVQTQIVQLQSDPNLPVGAVADEVYELQLMRDEMAKKLKAQRKDDGLDVLKDD